MGQLLDKEEELDEHYCTVQIKEFFQSRQGCRRTNQHLAEFVEMCTQHISSMKKLLKQQNKETELVKKQANIIERFLITLQLTQYLSTPLIYHKVMKVPSTWLKNILVTGNIGNGKSTFCNCFAGKEIAHAAKSTGTQTLGLDAYQLPDEAGGVRILDTQGFDCPQYTDIELYNKLCINLLKPPNKEDKKKYAAIKEQGISCLVTPIAIPTGGRLEESQVKVIFHTIMIFQLLDNENLEKGLLPKYYIIFNLITKEDNQFLEFVNAIRTQIAERVFRETVGSDFDFVNGTFNEPTPEEKQQRKDEIQRKVNILFPDDNFFA